MESEIKKEKTKKVWFGENDTRTLSCHYLGEITLGKHVHISDPCYDRSVWCRVQLENMVPGAYRVYTIHNDDDNRVHMLLLLNAEKYDPWQFFVRWKMGGNVSVDSGQMGVFDDSIYPKEEETGEFDDVTTFYGKCCHATLSNQQEDLIDGAGAVTSSGWGDGTYSFFTNDTVRKNAILIDYLSETDGEAILTVVKMSDPKTKKAKGVQ